MNSIYRILLFAMIISMAIITSCEKKVPPVEPVVETPDHISVFVWSGLKDYYLWYDLVTNLDEDNFTTNDEFYEFLNAYGDDYEQLFYDLLYQYGTVDKWSWIVDDWEELENSFAGISKSMGYNFRLVRFSGSDDLFGYVRYVIPDSPAADANVERGDIFLYVDNETLTINNYMDLLVNSDSYTLSFASIINNNVSPNGVTASMVAVELQENPVHYYSVMDVGGVQTGYLVYNSFTSNFDIQLNDVFTYFSDQSITRLILDLRYNGGGSIKTAVYLASMIYSNQTDKLFSKSQWNDKLNAYITGEYGADYLNYYFADVISATSTTEETQIANLGLLELYVITTGGTASASELIINGLIPYIDVKLVGENTTGKYVGSITLKDYDTQGIIATDHKWALQPIVLKLTNSAGVSDYINGLSVDEEVSEDFANLLPFGDENETMLKATVDYILGTKSSLVQPQFIEGIDYEVIADSKDFVPHSKEMYLQKEFRIIK